MQECRQGHSTEGSHTGVYGNTGTEAGGLFDLILLLLTAALRLKLNKSCDETSAMSTKDLKLEYAHPEF